jgi:hypothetical protein
MTIDIDSTVAATIILRGANRDCHHSLTMCTRSLNVWLPPAVTIVCLTRQIPGLFTFFIMPGDHGIQSTVVSFRLPTGPVLPLCNNRWSHCLLGTESRSAPKLSFIDLRRATCIGPSFGQKEDLRYEALARLWSESDRFTFATLLLVRDWLRLSSCNIDFGCSF